MIYKVTEKELDKLRMRFYKALEKLEAAQQKQLDEMDLLFADTLGAAEELLSQAKGRKA